MTHALSKSGLVKLKNFLKDDPLIGLDFDGTLSPIRRDPENSKLSQELSQLIKALNEKIPVAILSGRGGKDLARRIPSGIAAIIGNHGIEGPWLSQRQRKNFISCSKAWMKALKKLERIPGIELEDKELSLCVHFRDVDSSLLPEKFLRAKLLKDLEALKPKARIVDGKKVYSLLPSFEIHKGLALLKLAKHERKKAAIFIGDDETDEDAFRIPPSKNFKVLGIRIGKAPQSSADLYLKRQSEIKILLRMLLSYKTSYGIAAKNS